MVHFCHHTKANTVHPVNYMMQLTLLLVMLFSVLPTYDLCGKPNALGVTDWGLKNNYVTGEWWRGDTRAGWWEYCMYKTVKTAQ